MAPQSHETHNPVVDRRFLCDCSAFDCARLDPVHPAARGLTRVVCWRLPHGLQAVRVKRHPNVVNVRFAHIMGFCSENEEYFCFEDFVTGKSLEELVTEGEGELYDGTPAEVTRRRIFDTNITLNNAVSLLSVELVLQ